MKILNKVSIKNLKFNKKRTISTIIGIILSVALICAVATMAISLQATLVQEAVDTAGYYHLKLSNITNDNLKTLQNNRDIKSIYTIYENGYGELQNMKSDSKPYLKLLSMNRTTFEYLKFNLIEGKFPKDSNEIIIASNMINKRDGEPYKIGDKIKLDLGQRTTLDGEKLYSHNPYIENEEKISEAETSEVTIVGIMERPSSIHEGYNDPGYTAITTNNNEGNKIAYIALNNPKQYEKSIAEILGVSEIDDLAQAKGETKYEEFEINEELLKWEVFKFSDSTISMIYTVAAVVVIIIIFTSVFCIRNSFAIATAEKTKMYGMLASIGATKKQIRKNVIFEGLILGTVGIPLGILSGIFACFVLVKIVNAVIGEYLFARTGAMVLEISILPIILSAILGIVTIYLSSISSAKKASKVSPIENLRNSNDIKIKNKKLKVPKIIQKIFKTGGVLAYKNLKRSKKKYRTTVISIAVSVCIFISMNSLLTYAFGLTGVYYKDYNYNLILYNSEGILEQNKNSILAIEGIDEYFINYRNPNSIRISDKSKVNEEDGFIYNVDYYYSKEKNEEIFTNGPKVANLWLVGLDDNTFQKYCKKAGLDYNKVKKDGILCDLVQYLEEDNASIKQTRRYKYKAGDTITGKFEDKEINVKVGAVTETQPYGKETVFYDGGYIVFDVDEFKDIEFELNAILINTEDTSKIMDEVEKIHSGIERTDIQESEKAEKSMILIVSIFLYGFITVITLIGITNIFNTITSNMELRQKEFAMLKSIGMTKKEFNRMIRLETLFYGTKSLIYGIASGLLATFALYKAFSIKLDSGIKIPYEPILISIIGVFVLVFIIMKYSINKINKQNTIETIRKENI